MTAVAVVVALGVSGCRVAGASHPAFPQPPRARAFVDRFDRILSQLSGRHVSDLGNDLDISEETARVLGMTLRSKGLDVYRVAPVELRRTRRPQGDTEDAIFANVPFRKRLGEEYREPLILTTRRIFSADHRVNSLQLTLKATVSE